MGCRPAHLVFILGVVVILMMVFELGSFLIGSLVGFLYPGKYKIMNIELIIINE